MRHRAARPGRASHAAIRPVVIHDKTDHPGALLFFQNLQSSLRRMGRRAHFCAGAATSPARTTPMGPTHMRSGGRLISQNAVERLRTFGVRGPMGRGASRGVVSARRPCTDVFLPRLGSCARRSRRVKFAELTLTSGGGTFLGQGLLEGIPSKWWATGLRCFGK